MIHVSLDGDEAGMKHFLGKEDAPFPAVKHSKVQSLKVLMQHRTNRVPQYILVDTQGEAVAHDLGPILSKIKSL